MSGAFLPSSLADLWSWWDIATISTLYQDSAGSTPVTTNADPIGYIADRSGNGRYVRQTGATSTRPTYTTGVQNGLPAASFDGGDYLDSVATVDNRPITIAYAVKRFASVNATRGIITTFTSAGTRAFFTSGNNVSLSVASPSASNDSVATFGANSALIGFAAIASTVSDNWTNATKKTGSHTSSVTNNIVSLGKLTTGSTSSLLSGYLCEICIYNRVLSDTEIGQLATYLNSKWSVY